MGGVWDIWPKRIMAADKLGARIATTATELFVREISNGRQAGKQAFRSPM